ncbi:3437_t:CDS:2, partial [Funneliformis caledonium]
GDTIIGGYYTDFFVMLVLRKSYLERRDYDSVYDPVRSSTFRKKITLRAPSDCSYLRFLETLKSVWMSIDQDVSPLGTPLYESDTKVLSETGVAWPWRVPFLPGVMSMLSCYLPRSLSRRKSKLDALKVLDSTRTSEADSLAGEFSIERKQKKIQRRKNKCLVDNSFGNYNAEVEVASTEASPLNVHGLLRVKMTMKILSLQERNQRNNKVNQFKIILSWKRAINNINTNNISRNDWVEDGHNISLDFREFQLTSINLLETNPDLSYIKDIDRIL